MAFEILDQAGPPRADGLRPVRYRTAAGETGTIHVSVPPGEPADPVWLEGLVEYFAASENRDGPPISFGLFVRMDMSSRSYEELQQDYREIMDEAGYDVDEDMEPRKRQPAR